VNRHDRVSLQRVTALALAEPHNDQVSGQIAVGGDPASTRRPAAGGGQPAHLSDGRRVAVFHRKVFSGRSSDVVLAVVGLGITQLRILHAPGGWPHAPVALLVLVALAPALIAVRRVDPVLASVSLVAGGFASLLLGQTDWVLLTGCGLALWSLPARCRLSSTLATTVVTAALPLLAATKWLGLLHWAYPSIYTEFPERASETIFGITQQGFDKIKTSGWPWWQSIALLLVGCAGAVYRRRRTEPRTAGERLDDLWAFLLDRDRAVLLDCLLAVAVASTILVEQPAATVLGLRLSYLWGGQADGSWWSAPDWMPYAIAYSALTLALRRRWPGVPVTVLTAGALLTCWQTSDSWSVLGALAIALYSLAAGRSPRFSLPVTTAVLVAAPAVAALVRYPQMVLISRALKHQPVMDSSLHNSIYKELVDRHWPVSLSLILALPVCVGVLVHLYRRNREAAAREAELKRRTAEQDAVQVVLTERSQIARDLHDVVAHHVNLMVIQAETGPDLAERDLQEVLAGFQRIGDAGRRALGELDRMLSALRDADGLPDPALTPQPVLHELEMLARSLTEQGLPVDLEVRGTVQNVPEGIQLTAYRLVQEALTNVVKHARAGSAKVLVEGDGSGVAVWVIDDGQGFAPANRPDGRHGLTGMRERVRIHGGRMSIAARPGAGTTVSAWLPADGMTQT
jgi:signal transduction histidine kinase